MKRLMFMLASAMMFAVPYATHADLSSHEIIGDPIPNLELVQRGNAPLREMIPTGSSLTNALEGMAKGLASTKTAVDGLGAQLDAKQNKLIAGNNVSIKSEIFKLTTSGTTLNGANFIYTSSTNVSDHGHIVFYDSALEQIADNVCALKTGTSATGLVLTLNGSDIPVTSVERPDIKTLNFNVPEDTTYRYALPSDWRIVWTALSESDSSGVETNSVTDTAGRVITEVSELSVRNARAQLSIQYFDEVNVPNFHITKFEVVSGPATIDANNVLTATSDGVVTVRAHTSTGDYRDCPIPMYRHLSGSSYKYYSADTNVNRKRVNDWHLSLLQNYRATPSTNYHYTTWNEPTSTHHWANPGDRFTGEYGKNFHPFSHVTANSSGSASWWWSHAVVSKHVLLAAAHYGWNHDRILNGYSYINWDGGFSGKKQLKLVRYVNLSEWAAANGFEGSDAQCGDLAFFVVEGEIPDECLPYLATSDYLNMTYGVPTGDKPVVQAATSISDAYLSGVSLNQANMVALRGLYGGTSWGSHVSGPLETQTVYSDGIIKDLKFREDIYQYVRLGCWHSVVMGDSGHPMYLYDPALTTGLTDNDGRLQCRPILISAYHFASGGPPLSRHLRVIKAFVESVGDTLDYVLGDPSQQSSDNATIRKNAIEAMGKTEAEVAEPR